MTTREERTRNLLQAGAFLKEIQANKSLPVAVRDEARRLLRHFPTAVDIDLLANVEKSLSGSNLLTPEFDPSWVSAYQTEPLKVSKKRASKAGKQMANPDPLAALRDDFDRLVERMQTPAAKATDAALLAATGAELGALATAHARESARKDATLRTEPAAKTRARKRSIPKLSRKVSAQSHAANKSMEASLKDGLDSPGTKRSVRKSLLDRMVKSTERASVAIDDAVAYVEASNRKRARRMHILFVCSLCRLRSPTAEQVFATRADWDVMAAGINAGADNPVTPELLEWADTIFVMEEAHRSKLSRKFSAYLKDKRVVCLNIPDKYDHMDPRLVRQLKAKVPKLLR